MSDTEKIGPFFAYADAAQALRRPFTPDAVRWKLQTTFGQKKDEGADKAKGGLVVAYIDARLVIERLNLLTPNWSDQYTAGDHMRCDLTVCGLTRSGFGKGRDLKASESDSLKRAGVKFGVGVSLYALAEVKLWRVAGDEPVGNKLRGDYRGHLALDDANRAWLRDRYAAWLETDRGKHFGEPLDHGDMFGAVGDPSDQDQAEDTPADDPRSVAEASEMARLGEELEVAYLSVPSAARRSMPPGKFRARVEAAKSVDDLGRLLVEVQAMDPKAVAA